MASETFELNLAKAREAVARGDIAQAEPLLKQLIEQDANHIEALDMLGNLLGENNRSLEAAEFICRAFVLKPAETQLPKMRGIAYYILGRMDEAAEVYRQWMEHEPDNAIPQHLYAACSGKFTPERASDGYISAIFDEYAPHFDARLRQLGYRVPEQMLEQIQTLALPCFQWDILDAGCGTGMLGPLVKPWAKSLTGVDLSTGMLSHAQARGCYTALINGELGKFIENHPNHFDLICMADTLNYFGDLDQVLIQTFAALRPRGKLLFNTERTRASKPGGFTLSPSGRFEHHHDYVEKCLGDAGFTSMEYFDISVRVELGNSVEGELVLACRA